MRKDVNTALDKILNGRDKLKEIITLNELIERLEEKKKIVSLWGVTPKIIHLGYDRFIVKQMDLIEVGFKHNIIIADLYLLYQEDDKKDIIKLKTKYFIHYLKLVGLKKAKFITLSRLEKKRKFWEYFYLVSKNAKLSEMEKLGVLRNKNSLGSFICAGFQLIDHLVLSADVVYGGKDQRGIYILSREICKKEKLNKPIILLGELSHDILGRYLSQSRLETRITIHDNFDTLFYKIKKMFCPPNIVENNPVLEYLKFSVFPFFNEIIVRAKHGKIEIKRYEELEELYRKGFIHPLDLKKTLYEYLKTRISKIQQYFEKRKKLIEWIDLNLINKNSTNRNKVMK